MKKTVFVLIYLIIFCGCASSSFSIRKAYRLSYKPFVTAGCQIFDDEMRLVKTLPGYVLCLPDPDGGWTVVSPLAVYHYNFDGQIKWNISGFFHHQAVITEDRYTLALGSETIEQHGVKTRFDIVYKIDPFGNIVAKNKLSENFKDYLKFKNSNFNNPALATDPFIKTFSGAEIELTHINTINESQNGYIIYDLILGSCVVLDKKSLQFAGLYFTPQAHQALPDPSKTIRIHDCQKTDDDNWLFYSNSEIHAPGQNTFALHEVSTGKSKTLYFDNPSLRIDTSMNGSVQKLGERGYLATSIGPDGASYLDFMDAQGNSLFRKKILSHVIQSRVQNLQSFIERNEAE